jgi:hypothetical protein
MHPRGAKRNNEDQATFSKAGPYLSRPETTSKPNVIPKVYRLTKRSIKAGPKFNIETPKKGVASSIAGTIPIKVLIKAVAVRAVIISLIFKGAMNKLVKFLLQISSRNNILKLMLERNKKS